MPAGNIRERGAQRVTTRPDYFTGITVAVQQVILADPVL